MVICRNGNLIIIRIEDHAAACALCFVWYSEMPHILCHACCGSGNADNRGLYLLHDIHSGKPVCQIGYAFRIACGCGLCAGFLSEMALCRAVADPNRRAACDAANQTGCNEFLPAVSALLSFRLFHLFLIMIFSDAGACIFLLCFCGFFRKGFCLLCAFLSNGL